MQDRANGLMDIVVGLEVPLLISPQDGMAANHRHYFSVGRGALLNIFSALVCRLSYGGGESPIANILDYGCGHGRVARYLRAAFPKSTVYVSDLNRDGVDWCIDNLGCKDMGPTIQPDQYDLIWLGSVFTHLPETTAIELLESLKRALRPNGVLIFSTQGRWSATNLEAYVRGDTDRNYLQYGLSPEAAKVICSGFRHGGYGYHDYTRQTGYGIAVVDIDWYRTRLVDDRFLFLMAQERGWDTHHDVIAAVRTVPMFHISRGRNF